jgi:hypothetical protein
MQPATEIHKRMIVVKDVTRKSLIEKFAAEVKLTNAGAKHLLPTDQGEARSYAEEMTARARDKNPKVTRQSRHGLLLFYLLLQTITVLRAASLPAIQTSTSTTLVGPAADIPPSLFGT